MERRTELSLMSSSAVVAPPAQRSRGVWAAAWLRLRADRVGMLSMSIVLFFLVLVLLTGLGLVAKDWQRELGVPNAPPTLMGPAPAEAAAATNEKSIAGNSASGTPTRFIWLNTR